MSNHNEQVFTGVLEDNRAPSDKQKDYQHQEVVAGAGSGIVRWGGLSDKYKSYPIRDQDGSSSCVAQTGALMLGIENETEEGVFVELSAGDIYTRRSNNGGGMIGDDAFRIMRDHGATLEMFMPSQRIGESEINRLKRKPSFEQVGKVFRTNGWVYTGVANIEEAAEACMQGYPVMVWFRFPRAEWTSRPRLSNKMGQGDLYLDQVGENKNDVVHHSVTILPYSAHIGEDGKKYVIIQDSWGHHSTTQNGLRYISEEYYQKRHTLAGYNKPLPNNWRDNESVPDIDRPVVNIPLKTLRFGQRSAAVAELQKVLKYEEVFPQTIDITGYYGSITVKAVKSFQVKYGLSADGIAGPKTIGFINKQFS